MLNIKESPYRLLLFTAIALSLALAFLPVAHSDFQNKTMFTVPLAIFIWAIPLLLITLWALYLLTKRFLFSKSITWTHVLITVSTAILTVIILYIVIYPWQSESNSYFGSNRVEVIGNAIRIVFYLFVFGQFTFLINVLPGLYKKFNKQPPIG